MANIKELEKYIGYEFSSLPFAGKDYKSFETKYINYLKKICVENNWELVNIGKNHYCFSVFVKNNDKYIYISISDVRYFSKDWYNHILIRTAKSERDYSGGSNNYTELKYLEADIRTIFKLWNERCNNGTF